MFGHAIGRLGERAWVKRVVKKVKTIVYFIWQHHVPITIFCHYETNLMFQNPLKCYLQPIF
jgi:hypothetical protein